MFNNQLPVPYNQVDQSTFNGNLPNGNDRVPNINLSQAMMQNQQIALQAIGYFRLIAQSVVQKTPLHAFSYNLLAQNGFQNQVWQTWCQTLVTLVEILIAVKGYNTNDAIKKACEMLYEAFMSMAFKEYPGIQQVTPQNMWNNLQVGVQLYNQISSDCQRYIQGGPAAFQNQNTGFNGFPNNNNGFNNNNNFQNNSGNLPRINVGGGNNNGAAVTSSFGQSRQGSIGMPLNNNAAGDTGVGGGLYDEPLVQAQKPLQPVEEISSDVYSQYPTESFPEMNLQSSPAPQHSANFTQSSVPVASNPEMEELPVPLNLDEIVIDPTYYQPVGYKLNMEGLYDHFYNPGGIEIRLAHKSPWEVTIGDMNPYRLLNDPEHFVMFHVKFPDGVVLEHNVKWTPQMEYARHELNDELRRRAQRPNGIVVESKHPISSLQGDPEREDEIALARKENDLPHRPGGPVIMSQIFNGSTDLEIKAAVIETLEDLTGETYGPENPLPPIEYLSVATHLLRLSDEEFAQLDELSKCKDLGRVALDLKDMQLAGMDSGYYRFLNQRLTRSINRFMSESMSLNVSIDDFANELGELLDYLSTKKGQKYLDIIRKGANDILLKAIAVEETDQGRAVVDYNLNYQLPWFLDEMTSLNVHSGKPVLVSNASHAGMQDVLRGMIQRVGPANVDSRNLRLITADGAVLRMIRGFLVDKAILLKLEK